MRGIFLYYKNINYNNLSGIDKKVLWQIDALKERGNNCELVIMDKHKSSHFSTLVDQLLITLPYGNAYPKWEYMDQFNDIDFIYLRRPTCFSIHTIRVLKKIKKMNTNCKIILEIPTYPYDKELLVKLRYLPLYLKDRYNRTKLKKYVDRIAVQNDVTNIFGIPTVRFTNGIRVEEINIRNPVRGKSNLINLCAIASLNPWQGYERVIKGIHNYLQKGGKRNIIFHLVGDGCERQYYQKLVKDLKLEDNIIFYGSLYGKELDRIYNISDIALDAFGRYKTDNELSTSLKSREYLAKGLPIVSGCKVDILNDNSLYYMEFPSDNSIIDINRIVQFHDDIYGKSESKLEISRKVREYAYEVCDVSKTMRHINEYILS